MERKVRTTRVGLLKIKASMRCILVLASHKTRKPRKMRSLASRTRFRSRVWFFRKFC